MSIVLHKQDIINQISDKLIDEKIVIGGNGKKYKRKYHLKYTQKIIANVLEAFWEVIAEAVEEGNSIKINSYVKMEPKYYKAFKLNANGFSNIKENIVPARYRVRFTMGERLKEACKRLSQKKCNDSAIGKMIRDEKGESIDEQSTTLY